MMNSLRLGLCGVAASVALLSPLAARATTKSYTAPADTVILQTSTLPGYAKAAAICTACHSAEYIRYQPPTAARPYWTTMVNRMKNVFNAPVQEADIPDIVDYLVKTYGNEQPK